MSAELIGLLEQIGLLAIQNAPAIADDIRMVLTAVQGGASLTDEQMAQISARLDASYQDLMKAIEARNGF